PFLPALERRDHGVAGRLVVLQRVRMLGILAAPDGAAREAHAKLGPRLAERHAGFAAARAGRHGTDHAEVLARLDHRADATSCVSSRRMRTRKSRTAVTRGSRRSAALTNT